MQGIIMIDWVSINVKSKYANFRFNDKYEVRNTGIHSRHFLCLDDIFYKKEKIASISHTPPKNSVIPKDLVQLKFDNKFLYGANLKKRIEVFLEENNLIFKSFSRLDICYDFNFFCNGWTGQQFVNKFSKCQIERKRDGEYQIRGRKSAQGRRENYLRFGSSTSSVQLYMYDKSLEIAEKKHKPYIVKTWEANGIDKKNVWRIEFKLVDFSKGFCFNNQKEIVAFTMRELDLIAEGKDYANYKLLFKFLYYKYFFFYKTSTAKSNVSRNKRIHLITDFKTAIRLDWFTIKNTEQSGRTEKVIIKRVNEHYNEVRKLKSEAVEIQALQYGLKHYLNNTIETYGLQEWAHKKLDKYNPESDNDNTTNQKIKKFIKQKVYTK